MLVVTVLRTLRMLSCDFSPRIVQAVQRMVKEHSDADFLCVSDVPVKGVECVPMEHRWPTWYSKMEMFSPRITGDFLYIDLDMVIVGDISDFLKPGEFTGIRDPHPGQFGSQLMRIPEKVRPAIWEDWMKDPWNHIVIHNQPGKRWDSGFLEKHVGKTAKHWEDELPGQIAYAKQTRHSGVPSGARIVNSTGRPRPWDTAQFGKLYK